MGITLWDYPKPPSSSWSLNQERMKKSRSMGQWSDLSSLTRSEAVILQGSPGWGAQARSHYTLTLGPSLLAHCKCETAISATLPCWCHTKQELPIDRGLCMDFSKSWRWKGKAQFFLHHWTHTVRLSPTGSWEYRREHCPSPDILALSQVSTPSEHNSSRALSRLTSTVNQLDDTQSWACECKIVAIRLAEVGRLMNSVWHCLGRDHGLYKKVSWAQTLTFLVIGRL